MARWTRTNRNGGITVYYEIDWIDGDEWVTRQIELRGDDGVPIAAASLDEWTRALAEGGLEKAHGVYRPKYGALCDQPASVWSENPTEVPVTPDEFEEAWREARQRIERGERSPT